jgi:hypothetical protein
MRSHIVVGLAVLVLPIAVSFGCGDLAEATGDRAFDWSISKAPEETATPDRVSVILEHPDIAVLTGRATVKADVERFRVHAVVYPHEGTPIDMWGLWDTWGNFSAKGGNYYLAGTADGGVAHMKLTSGVLAWGDDGVAIRPEEIIGSLERCLCMPTGQRPTCVKCGSQAACCMPDPF